MKSFHKLKSVIAELVASMPTASPADGAKAVMAGHAALVDECRNELILKQLALMWGIEARKSPMIYKRPRLRNPNQYKFPEFEDVIPTVIYIAPATRTKQAKRVRLLNATLDNQIASLALALDQSAAELTARRRLIALTRRYDKSQPGIKVREVLKLQAIRNAEAARKRAARARIRSKR